jgi:hemolysin activation/secretion protein
MRILKNLLIISMLCACCRGLVFGQTPPVPAAIASEQEQLQRRQQQEQQELLRAREVEAAKKAQQASGAVAGAAHLPPPSAAGSTGCLDLRLIQISGVKKLNKAKIQQQSQRAVGACTTKEALQQIQSDIQQAYIDKGYIAARVYFDFKNLAQKRLDIIVEEGFLEQIILLEPKTKTPQSGLGANLKKFTAFPFTHGRVLNLRSLEQGVEQMNKLSSSRATMEVIPGERAGGSVVLINNEPLPQNAFTLSYDNSGGKSTGARRVSAGFSRDNLLSLNENIYLNASSSVGEPPAARYSRSFVAAYAMPLGYFTFSGSFNYSEYLSTTPGLWADVKSSGDSAGASASAEYTFARGRSYKTGFGAQLAFKQSKNYVEDVYIAASSRILSVGTLYLTGTYYSVWGSFYSKLSLNRGLPLLGAAKDSQTGAGYPRAQYSSAGLYLNYSNNISVFSYNLSFDGQYGFDDMFGSEQMMIGSGSVRGFKEGGAGGESGFIVKQDLKVFLANVLGRSHNKYLDKILSGLYAGVFVDYGCAAPKTFGGGVNLAGGGAKLGFYGKYLTADVGLARALLRPDFIDNEGGVFYINASLNVAF